jgi:hypothetical protein
MKTNKTNLKDQLSAFRSLQLWKLMFQILTLNIICSVHASLFTPVKVFQSHKNAMGVVMLILCELSVNYTITFHLKLSISNIHLKHCHIKHMRCAFGPYTHMYTQISNKIFAQIYSGIYYEFTYKVAIRRRWPSC